MTAIDMEKFVDYLLNSGVGSKTSAVQEVGKRLGLDVVDVSISSSNTLTRKQHQTNDPKDRTASSKLNPLLVTRNKPSIN